MDVWGKYIHGLIQVNDLENEYKVIKNYNIHLNYYTHISQWMDDYSSAWINHGSRFESSLILGKITFQVVFDLIIESKSPKSSQVLELSQKNGGIRTIGFLVEFFYICHI